MQYRSKPFENDDLNEMELRGISVAAVTIYAGLYYLTNDLDGPGRYFFFFLIVFVNLYFLLYWLFKFFHSGLISAAKKIPKIQDILNLEILDEKAAIELWKFSLLDVDNTTIQYKDPKFRTTKDVYMRNIERNINEANSRTNSISGIDELKDEYEQQTFEDNSRTEYHAADTYSSPAPQFEIKEVIKLD